MSTVFGLGLLIVLAVLVLPVPRVRRWLLTVAARLGQAVILAGLGACGTFFVQPRAAPQCLTLAARPLFDDLLMLPLDNDSGLPWLVLAVLVVAVSLPVLLAVEWALSLSIQTAQLQALRRELRRLAVWIENRLAAFGMTSAGLPPLANECAAASEALRSAGQSDKQLSPTPVPLVLDLLK